MKLNKGHLINVATATFPYSIILDSATTRYDIYGTKALVADIAINPSGTPSDYMMVVFNYRATITTTVALSRFGDHELTIFGTKVPYSYLAKKLKIYCEFSSSVWNVWIIPSIDTIPSISLELLKLDEIVDDSTMSYDGTTGKLKVKDDGITVDQLDDDAVETDKVKNKAITLGKMADIARGSIIVGGASDAPTLLDGKTAAQILVGDGTDVKSVAVTGDIDLTAAGVSSIGASKVLAAMIKDGEIDDDHINSAAAIKFTKMLALAASKIPVLNVSGFIEASAIDVTKLAFVNVTTAGTAEASKAVVLDASKKINELDITVLKLNGITLTATAAQIDAMVSGAGMKEPTTDIIADTTATAATLCQVYVATTTAGAVNLTLPEAATVEADTVVTLIQKGANAATLVADPGAGDDIENKTGGSVASLAASGNGGWIKVVCDGGHTWKVVMSS